MDRVKIINKNIVDLRKEHRFESERVSQALFNTPCEVLSEREGWALVETPDGYRGWVEGKHLADRVFKGGSAWKVKSNFAPVRTLTGKLITLFAFDTRFHATEAGNDLILEMPDGVKAKVSRRYCKPAEGEPKWRLRRLAQRFIGVPYLWGGVSPFGFDCSGYVQRLFHYCGIQIPRDTAQQIGVGEKIEHIEELQFGDLIFFPRHVGLYLGEGVIIHSSLHFHGVVINDLYNEQNDYIFYLKNHFLEGRRIKWQ